MEEKPALATSQFYMWRCLLAIAWADGHCGAEQVAYFAKVFDNLPRYYALTQSQRDTLANDLEAPSGPPESFFPYINDPEVRAMLVLYAQDLVMLAHIDPNEDAIIKRLRLWEHPAYDKESLRTEIRGVIAERRQQSEEEKQALWGQFERMHPLYAAIDKLLLRLGIDLID